MKNNKGFTLMELMVVIAIIIILAGFLTPALNRARRQARKVECMNNLKQASIAIHAYALDWDGKFPDAIGDLFDDYVSTTEVLQCTEVTGAATFQYDTGLTESTAGATVPIFACPAGEPHIGPKHYNVLYGDGHVASVESEPSL